MAAQNITATLEGHKAELSAALAANQAATDSLRAELNGKIDA
jgi:hypothetical protein